MIRRMSPLEANGIGAAGFHSIDFPDHHPSFSAYHYRRKAYPVPLGTYTGQKMEWAQLPRIP